MAAVTQAVLLADLKSVLGNDFYGLVTGSVVPTSEYASAALGYRAINEAMIDARAFAYSDQMLANTAALTPGVLTTATGLYTVAPAVDWSNNRGVFEVWWGTAAGATSPPEGRIRGWERVQTAAATTAVFKLLIPPGYETTGTPTVGRNLWIRCAVALPVLTDALEAAGASSYDLTGVDDEAALRRYLARQAVVRLIERQLPMVAKGDPAKAGRLNQFLQAMVQLAGLSAQQATMIPPHAPVVPAAPPATPPTRAAAAPA